MTRAPNDPARWSPFSPGQSEGKPEPRPKPRPAGPRTLVLPESLFTPLFAFQHTLLFSLTIHLYVYKKLYLSRGKLVGKPNAFQVLGDNGAHKCSKNKAGIFNPAPGINCLRLGVQALRTLEIGDVFLEGPVQTRRWVVCCCCC